ncbi:hypothetical protein PVK06_027831 [Gossypium arboreum]|uniref:Uncharacterized protein n=1 Tax=Gossypium arboreum TaxID=29729 RepID=A0ABR0P1E8_GOSAR|nr:hypothetical protein PVK06_027831 [Gossypium arboreum]
MDLVEHSFSYRKWEITSIFYNHAVAIIHLKGDKPETYVDNCYVKETQLAIYSNFLRPIRGPKQ